MLNFYDKRKKYSDNVILFMAKMRRRTMRTCIVIVAGDKIQVQELVMWLSPLVYVDRDVNFGYIERWHFLNYFI